MARNHQVRCKTPRKVLITGGHELGGVGLFANALKEGFAELGISAEVISPGTLPRRWRELCDPSVLMILSTSAIFAAPFAARSISVAHGFPGAYMDPPRMQELSSMEWRDRDAHIYPACCCEERHSTLAIMESALLLLIRSSALNGPAPVRF